MVIDFAPLLAFASAVLTAIITVFGTIWVAKARTKIDIGTTITSGFRELTDQLQEERIQLSDLIREHREDLAASEKVVDDQERAIRRLRRHLVVLEDRMEKAGLDVPPKVGWE